MDLRRRLSRHVPQARDLRACPRCASLLVQELRAWPCAAGGWHVERWCPECGWSDAVRCSAGAYADFGEHLQAGRDRLRELLRHIEAGDAESEDGDALPARRSRPRRPGV